ncbi:unnamed protein product [Protopolystoma xenopodis]|uniref:Uncharacterized protein n=1 Tax=Protopolystoma xenopodis TaxID=117903 RepID=A0A3S5AMN6_9PLAT|nr:unnamed protein product [Protopolystoma xenopodis]
MQNHLNRRGEARVQVIFISRIRPLVPIVQTTGDVLEWTWPSYFGSNELRVSLHHGSGILQLICEICLTNHLVKLVSLRLSFPTINSVHPTMIWKLCLENLFRLNWIAFSASPSPWKAESDSKPVLGYRSGVATL